MRGKSEYEGMMVVGCAWAERPPPLLLHPENSAPRKALKSLGTGRSKYVT